MQFDDRLATVLRSGAAGERAARTQFRQLLDLLGSTPPYADSPLVAAAFARLAEIFDELPAVELSRILREPGIRLRNSRLVAYLAEGEPQAAAAAIAVARLGEEEWLALIPNLSVTTRGFLRHRRDLPESARDLLTRFGVHDLTLPRPEGVAAAVETTESPVSAGDSNGGIAALVRRIEAFRQARRGGAAIARRQPLDVGDLMADGAFPDAFDFSTDAAGVIDWADPPVAPLLVGLRLAGSCADRSTALALRRRGVVRAGLVELTGLEAMAGAWRLDAAPRFDGETGAFRGHAGRMRRPPVAATEGPAGAGERMRQLLHELRTPVNAIQGFAEIIQQQLFGPAPNTYRALAGAIGVDAARLLAGFDEIDRLAQLESDALHLSAEGCDFRQVVEDTLRRLEGVTRPRGAHLRLVVSGERFFIGLGADDGALLAWRLLATLAGSLAAGEVVEIALRGDERGIALETRLPVALSGEEDLFAASARGEGAAVTAGMFGHGFTLRLARAEAEAAGGSLALRRGAIVLSLPGLTERAADHSQGANEGASHAA